MQKIHSELSLFSYWSDRSKRFAVEHKNVPILYISLLYKFSWTELSTLWMLNISAQKMFHNEIGLH